LAAHERTARASVNGKRDLPRDSLEKKPGIIKTLNPEESMFNFVRSMTSSTRFLLNMWPFQRVSNPNTRIVFRGMANQKHKKMIKLAKGYRGRTNCYSVAKHRVMKAMEYAYRDRKVRLANCFFVYLIPSIFKF